MAVDGKTRHSRDDDVTNDEIRLCEQLSREEAETRQNENLDLEKVLMKTWGHARLPIRGGGACFWRAMSALIKLTKDKVVMPSDIYAKVLHYVNTKEKSERTETEVKKLLDGGYNTEVIADFVIPWTLKWMNDEPAYELDSIACSTFSKNNNAMTLGHMDVYVYNKTKSEVEATFYARDELPSTDFRCQVV